MKLGLVYRRYELNQGLSHGLRAWGGMTMRARKKIGVWGRRPQEIFLRCLFWPKKALFRPNLAKICTKLKENFEFLHKKAFSKGLFGLKRPKKALFKGPWPRARVGKTEGLGGE